MTSAATQEIIRWYSLATGAYPGEFWLLDELAAKIDEVFAQERRNEAALVEVSWVDLGSG